jgi:hypothetical protein
MDYIVTRGEVEAARVVRQRATLTTLPLELREMIWSFVLVEREPIFSCTLQHSTPAQGHRRKGSKRARLLALIQDGYHRKPAASPARTTRTELWPRLPALTAVNHQIRQEALHVFFRDNVFVFRLNERMSTREVERWQTALVAQCPTLLPQHLFTIWTTRLEFMTQSPLGIGRQPAAIDCTLGPDSHLALSFSGGLAQECTCTARQHAKELSHEANINGQQTELIMKFTGYVEEQIRNDWGRRGRKMTPPRPCADCGMPRVERRTPEELKRFSDQYWATQPGECCFILPVLPAGGPP